MAGMNVNVQDLTSRIHDLICRAEPVDLAQLADPGIALDDVASTGPRQAALGAMAVQLAGR